MPVEFLTDEQAAAYGRYTSPVPRADLDRYFFLDDADRALIESKRREANRLGYAVQLCTARYLGTFLTDLDQVPEEAVVYLAEQLAVADPACLSEYATRGQTRLDHAEEIRREYGFSEFTDRRSELEEWLRAQVWTTTDGPKALFDGASVWLHQRGGLLPGATVLARLVAQVRDEVTGQLWQALCELITPAQRANLETLLVVGEGERSSLLDQLRKAPPAARGRRWCGLWTGSRKSSDWGWGRWT
nr:DUF4158 domain-containing protein [Nocardiopsis sp. SBT366]